MPNYIVKVISISDVNKDGCKNYTIEALDTCSGNLSKYNVLVDKNETIELNVCEILGTDKFKITWKK